MTRIVLLYRLIGRPLREDIARTLLTALAVALGVAVVLAIELAGESAAGSFRSSVETLAGDADFEVTATGGIPAAALTKLALLPYALEIRPRLEDFAVLPDSGRTIPLIGVDMLAPPVGSGEGESSAQVFQQQNSIWVGDGMGLHVGESVPLLINDQLGTYFVRGVLGKGSGEVAVMDLAPASLVLARGESLDRILIRTPDYIPVEQWEAILGRAIPEGVRLERFGTRTAENRRMLTGFRWNLRVLSYIALVVGSFLIYNTISVSVVRRRPEIGILRALGATRSGVLAAFLGEAACFGLIGGIAGVALGRIMAVGAVALVAATVESLYVSSSPGPIDLSWQIASLGTLLGICVATVSAAGPAWEASGVPPVEGMARARREHQVRLRKARSLAFAAIFAAAAYVASRQPPVAGKPLFGYAAAVLLIGASALAIPAAVSAISSTLASAFGRVLGVEALLAFRSLAGSLRRTSVLVGALSTAIAMMVAVGIMVGSFRQTVLLWMEDRLQADFYIRPAGPAGADRHPTMSGDIPKHLEALPEVAAVDRFRAYEISYNGMPATVASADLRLSARYGRRAYLSGADPHKIAEQLAASRAVVVSEPFANKHRVRTGDFIFLSLGGSREKFQVLDVYYDYASERGYVLMDRSTLLRYLPDPAPSNVAVYLKPGVTLDEGRKALEPALANRRVLVFSNRSLREEAIKVFDRTFAITYALEAVAVFVAVMGVAGALLALVIDRRREFGLLRFLGAAGGQVRRMILLEAGFLGLLANAAGSILGVLLSLVLIYVINRQSFGWTIQFHWPVTLLLGALSLIYAATILAGLYPAKIAMRLNPIEVIHED